MVGFALRLLVGAFGLWAASALVPGMRVEGAGTLLLAAFPFQWSNAPFALRLALVAAALVPLGVALGIFFPLGLRGQGPDAAPAAYAWDAVGAVLGFALFHLIAMPFGIPMTLYAGAASYLVALRLLREKRSRSGVGISRGAVE